MTTFVMMSPSPRVVRIVVSRHVNVIAPPPAELAWPMAVRSADSVHATATVADCPASAGRG